MIRIENLTVGYASGNNTRTVAAGLNASFHSGEMTCLIGANGVGKSTLLRTLSGFQSPLAGDIYIDGKRMNSHTPSQLSRMISVVLTDRPDTGNLTVEELVALGRSPYTGFWGTLKDTDREIVRESLKQTGIEHLASRMIGSLSDGERQKMMIAKALAQQTGVIYLDEPTAFLDYPSKVEIMQMLRNMATGTDRIIFMSTHDIELTLQIADRIWLMTQEGTLHVGTPRELSDNGSLSAFISRAGIRFDTDTMSIRVK
ncbi:ABC transporter ATP-binding protein [Xylanibacter caecicola]|uniref:ABC transporter ATP-binding protein n=1 Tax=Xylanibacter caecicola TaxID=2736294 RepID=UPI00258AC521|nr:ABC transporter ATP-binding protein [Xylanibacter caecicola]